MFWSVCVGQMDSDKVYAVQLPQFIFLKMQFSAGTGQRMKTAYIWENGKTTPPISFLSGPVQYMSSLFKLLNTDLRVCTHRLILKRSTLTSA